VGVEVNAPIESCRNCGHPVLIHGTWAWTARTPRVLHVCPRPKETNVFDQPDNLPESQSDMEQIKRNRWGQPLIVPPGGGKPVGYQRVTTFIKCLDDTAGLDLWKQRNVAMGLAVRPDLLLAVSSLAPGVLQENDADKKALNGICKEAMEAAGSSSRATIGTALHRITERIDRGETVDILPVVAADVEAYKRATARFEWLHIERMTVNDELQVAGTPDRIALVDGQPTVVDLKTGTSLWPGSHAMQMGVYANSDLYNIATAERTPLDVRLDKALVIHLPAGTGRCELVWVDIAAGWEAAQLAVMVRDWRKRRDLVEPYTPAPDRPDFAGLAALAGSPDDLMRLYHEAVEHGAWDDDLKAAFAARKAQLLVANPAA
jgi:hypothetical protein